METTRTLQRPTQALRAQGQSMWLDYIRRSLMTSGQLQRLIDEDELRGLTSNPAIFQQAIGGSDEYDDDLEELLEQDPSLDASALYEHLAVEDIQRAADVLRPVYDETGVDGVVSLEVSPHLARDTKGTIEEGRRLWNAVDRPNLMIKVPATEAGIPAIEQLISEGINVNVTLMFSLDHYEAVANAYIRGLERADDPRGIVSVASFFVSRVARAVDTLLEKSDADVDFNGGDVAVANARLAYQRFQEIFQGDAFAELRAKGAFVQRPLWASTSTKNPAYSDVRYVEELIGPETVNTIPPQTLDAFRDHGTVRGSTITEDLDEARALMDTLEEMNIDLDEITEDLQEVGVQKFATPFDDMLQTLEDKREALQEEAPDPVSFALAGHDQDVVERLQLWKDADFACRLWRHDPTLWADEDTPELTNRLGWLHLPTNMRETAEDLMQFADRVKANFDQAVVMGMGGSSLAPDVFSRVFGAEEDYLSVSVLDSTHPQAVQDLEATLDLERTLFIVASKSGTTTETLSFFKYFYDKVAQRTDTPGAHFVATTDEGTPLTELADERNFRATWIAPSDVGGRYAALTPFGLLPAALLGLDLNVLLDRAWSVSEASAFCVEAPDNSGLALGAALGELAKAGRNKVTFFTSPALEAFPSWLEQLIAESTGKDDTGIVPVAGEPLGAKAQYGDDRVFVYFGLADDADDTIPPALQALEDAGHPVLRFHLADPYDVAREMYRWEMAIAAAGAVLDIHPFNQPNVEAAKNLARQAMAADESATNGQTRTIAARDRGALQQTLDTWLDHAEGGGYTAVQAYLPMNASTQDTLQGLVETLRDETGLATTLGFGPRFLHSTGQLHKGGPANGLFLQLIDSPADELPVPETDYSFRELIAAQTVGDYQALTERDRAVLRVRIDNMSDVEALQEAVRERA
ncbi:MAG: bifunctional transaldolase/phosoglucose isomerase [Bacteroidetes bacterium]|nr:bifunctional transaldolase/phosoglucose isomerase [Bacteroidota bacterium]